MVSDEASRKQYAVLRVFVFVLLVAAPLAFSAIIYSMSRAGNRPIHPNIAFAYALLAIALVTAASVPVMEQLGFLREIGKSQMKKGSSPIIAGQAMVIVQLVQIESLYIYGMVLYFISGITTYLPYFAALGLLMTIMYWPSFNRFTSFVRSLEEA